MFKLLCFIINYDHLNKVMKQFDYANMFIFLDQVFY